MLYAGAGTPATNDDPPFEVPVTTEPLPIEGANELPSKVHLTKSVGAQGFEVGVTVGIVVLVGV